MQKIQYTQNNFISGEIDPKSTGLIGTPFFASAMKSCRGFLPTPAGGLMRTPGTKYIAEAHNSGYCRMEELLTDTATYIFEFYDKYVQARNISDDSLITGIVTDYTENELPELSIITNNGDFYIAHKNHQLTVFKVESNAITKTVPIYISGGVDFGTADNYPAIVSFKGGRMILASTNNKPVTIWQSRTPTIEDDTSIIPVIVNRYFDFTLFDYETTITTITKGGTIDELSGNTKKITVKDTTYSTGAENYYDRREVWLNRVTTTPGTDVVITTIKTTVTKIGTDEADALIDQIIQEEDIVTTDSLGVKTQQFFYKELPSFTPPTIATASTDETTEVIKVLNSSHAIESQEQDMYGTRIKWISSMGRLSVATSRAIFIDNGQIATPSTFDLSVSVYQSIGQSKSKSIRNYIIFTGNNNKSMFLSYYNYQSESLSAVEISKNARSLISSGIRDFTIMFDPFPIIWIVTNDGELVSCLINFTESGITPSWAVQESADNRRYISLCASGNYNNVLYLNIATDYDTGIEHTLEKITILEDTDVEDSFFVDKGVVKESATEISVITGLPYKDGTIVEVIADGYLLEKNTCYSNSITIETVAKNIIVGLPRSSYIVLFNPILSLEGTCIITKHKIEKVFLRLYKSGVGKIGTIDGKFVPILFRKFGKSLMGLPVELHTDDIYVNSPSTNTYTGNLKIIIDEPFPFNILAVSYNYNITED